MTDQLENIQQSTPEYACTKCRLYKTTTNVKINSVYPNHGQIDMAFIAEAPGETEETYGIPLIGPAGENLNLALKDAGINRDDVFIGNICRCRPPNNRTPSKDEMGKCYPYLLEELKILKPKIVVCLGLTAAKTLFKNSAIKMGESHGKFFNGSQVLGYDCVITLTWHPSPVTFMHGPNRRGEMHADIKRAYEHITQIDKPQQSKEWTDVVVTNKSTWDQVYPLFKKSPILVWDLETTGLDERANTAALTNVGLCCDKRFGVSIVNDESLWHNLDEYEQVMQGVDDLLMDNKIRKIAHNMKFDTKYYYAMRGVWANNWYWDTMLAHALKYPGQSNKLKDIAWTYTDMGGYEYELAEYGGLLTATPMERVEYNISDVICTFIIYIEQYKKLKGTRQEGLLQNVIMPAAEILAEMEYYGVGVDIFEIADLDRVMTKEINSLKRAICTHPNALLFAKHQTMFNPASHDHKRIILFDKKYFGFPMVKETKPGSGKASTDKEVLTTLAEGGSEFAQMLVDYSHITKLHGTYVKGQSSRIENERIYTTYNVGRARSGRLSSSNPNLQNIPKASNLKRIFIPEPGHTFISADFCAMEMMVSTYYTKDEAMIEAIKSGDAHTYIAMNLFNLSADEVGDKRRWVKALNFGVLYGIGAEKLGKNLGVTTEDAQKFINEYFIMFKPTKDWIDSVRKQAETEGYIASLFDRRRYYPSKNKSELNSAVNHPIQSLASDMTLYAMKLWKNYLVGKGYYPNRARMCLQVHDEICSTVENSLVNDIVFAKKRVLESVNFPFMTVPLEVEVKIGKNWGSLTKVKI